MKQIIYKFLFFQLMGWKLVGEMDKEIRKCVIIVAPHTSWHDFYVGLFARGIINQEMHYVAKKELFQFPFGPYFRWMGGAPLDRSGGRNLVDTIVSIFNKREVFRLAIAPEGTRKKVTEWKTGFYFIAWKAQVPIIPVAFDYKKKEVILHKPFYPSGNIKSDLPLLYAYYKGVYGRVPQHSFGI